MKTLPPTKTDAAFWETISGTYGWPVPSDWQQELYNYVILGLPPGSFFTAVFANDLYRAATSSHPANTWVAIVELVKWIVNEAPVQSFGSYEKVQAWLSLSKDARREILEKDGLLYNEKEVAWNILSSAN